MSCDVGYTGFWLTSKIVSAAGSDSDTEDEPAADFVSQNAQHEQHGFEKGNLFICLKKSRPGNYQRHRNGRR